MSKVNLDPGFFEFKGIKDIQRTYAQIEDGIPFWSSPNQKNVEYTISEKGTTTKNFAHEALIGIQEVTPFSLLFFSHKNIDELQKLIKYNVWIGSDKNYKIGNQSEDELKIIMRSVYLQYQKGVPNTSFGIKDGIIRLNKIAVNQLLPDLLSNITQYIGYIKDASTPLKPLPPPINMSQTGNKQLRDITQVLFGQSVSDYNSKFF